MADEYVMYFNAVMQAVKEAIGGKQFNQSVDKQIERRGREIYSMMTSAANEEKEVKKTKKKTVLKEENLDAEVEDVNKDD